MELPLNTQLQDTFARAQSILIALPAVLYADAVSSALALRLYLERMGKIVAIVTSSAVPEEFLFLPESSEIRQTLDTNSSLVVVLNTQQKKLTELSYEQRGDEVHIFLSAKDGGFLPEDISFTKTSEDFDLVVTIGAQSLESLGTTFTSNAELFYNAPKINIDTYPSNEYFGTINLIDVTASSLAEVLFDLFSQDEKIAIDADIATCLLAGIIANTHSFQDTQTTPKAFLKSARLVELGARQQDIIRYLFKTKQLPLLKLWGRALARVKTDYSFGYMYSVLSASDFQKTDSGLEYIVSVLQEFIDNVAGVKVIALVAEVANNKTRLLVALHPQFNLEVFYQTLSAKPVLPQRLSGTTRFIQLELPQGLQTVEQNITQALESALPKA